MAAVDTTGIEEATVPAAVPEKPKRAKRPAKVKAAEAPAPTEETGGARMVLAYRNAIVVPPGTPEKAMAAACKALGIDPLLTEVWELVAEKQGTKRGTIEEYAGKPGTPDAIQGIYRSVTAQSWKDAEVYEAPPAPLVQRRTIA